LSDHPSGKFLAAEISDFCGRDKAVVVNECSAVSLSKWIAVVTIMFHGWTCQMDIAISSILRQSQRLRVKEVYSETTAKVGLRLTFW